MADYINSYQYVTTNLYQSGSTPNPIIAELPFSNVQFTSQLNSIGTFQGDLLLSGLNPYQYNAIDGTVPGRTALYVIHDGFIVWGGIIWGRTWDSETQTLSVQAQETLSYFQHRRISDFTTSSYYNATTNALTYTNVDPVAIARDIVTNAQLKSHGNIGVTATGATTSGYSVTRSFFDFELKSVYQALSDLAQGQLFFDYYIRPSFNTSHQIINQFFVGSPTLGLAYDPTSNLSPIFAFPGNIVSYSYPEDATIAGNYVYGLGFGANYNRLIETAQDSALIGSGGTWPLLEETVNMIDIADPTTLLALTKGKIAAISYPPATVKVVIPTYNDPQFGSYYVGDQVRLDIQDEFFPNGLLSYYQNIFPSATIPIYRIVAIDVVPGEKSPDRVTVTLTLPLSSTIVNG